MTIAKRIDRKKRNRKLFNKLMAFYFALVSISACGYITALADDSNQYTFKGEEIVSSDILSIINIRNWFSNIFRPMGFGIMKWLARVISYFEDALDALLHINLYDLIKKVAKIDLDSWSYPIAWSVLALALIFVAVLLIFNADKTRLTDFGRGIITTGILIIALPALIRAFGDMRTNGIAAANEIRGDNGYAITEKGKVTNATLGQQLLADNVIDVDLSVKNRNNQKDNKSLSYYSESGYFTSDPKSVFDIDINGVSDNITQKIDVSTPVITQQHTFSSLDENAKLSLCGVDELYTMYKEGYNAAKDNFEKYKKKSDEDKTKDGYHPHVLSRKYWNGGLSHIVMTYTEEESRSEYKKWFATTDYNAGNKDTLRWAEYEISLQMVSNAMSKLKSAKVIKYNANDINNSGGGWGGFGLADLYRKVQSAISNTEAGKSSEYGTVSNTLKSLEEIKINVGEYTFSAIEWLNIQNNIELVESENLKNKGNNVDSVTKVRVYAEDLYSMDDYNNEDWISKLGILIKTMGFKTERVYKYDYNFWFAVLKLLCVAVCLLFAGLKVASTLYDILFAELIAPIVVASDMSGSGRAKQVIQNLFSSYLVMVLVVLLLRLYILVIYTISKDTSFLHNNLAAEIMIIIAGAKFVIDGPDLVVKLIGLDAGVKSGLGTIMGVRSAIGMARGAAHMASSATHTAVHNPVSRAAGGAAGGAVGGGATGGFGGMVGGAIGGAFSGAFGGGHGGSAYSRGVHTGERVGNALMNNHSNNNGSGTGGGTSGGQAPQSRNSNAGGHGGNNGNNADTGGTGGAGGHSGGAGGNNTVVKGEKGDKGDRGDTGMQGRQGERGQDANQTNQTGDWGRDEYRHEKTEGTAFKD